MMVGCNMFVKLAVTKQSQKNRYKQSKELIEMYYKITNKNKVRTPRKLKKKLKNANKFSIYKGNRVRVVWLGGRKGKNGNYNKWCITKNK